MGGLVVGRQSSGTLPLVSIQAIQVLGTDVEPGTCRSCVANLKLTYRARVAERSKITALKCNSVRLEGYGP